MLAIHPLPSKINIDYAKPAPNIKREDGINIIWQGLQQPTMIRTLIKSYLKILQSTEYNIFVHSRQIGQIIAWQSSDQYFSFQAILPEHSKAALNLNLIIGISYCSRQEIQQYNHQYRGKNYATNILTFPAFIQSPECIEQRIDLLLCPAVITEEAKQQNKSLFSHYAHLYLHGLLHGFGFDHENSEAEAREMEALESSILQKLGFIDPYANASY